MGVVHMEFAWLNDSRTSNKEIAPPRSPRLPAPRKVTRICGNLATSAGPRPSLAAPAPTLIVASASAAFVAFALAPTEAFAPLILENTMPLKTLGVIAMSNGVTSDFDHAAFDPKTRGVFIADTT